MFFVLSPAAFGDVRLPKIFTDHLVIQQELPVAVWGFADKGEKVSVALAGKSAETTADKSGKWRVDLPAMKADGKTHTLKVKGNNTLELEDVVIGEVWLASGQSNMNRPVGRDAISKAKYPNLRLFTTNGKIPRRDTLNDTVGWVRCTPETLAVCGDIIGANNRRRPFSEVAYHFARDLHEAIKLPVGIIHTSMGGSTAKDWTPNPKLAEKYPFDKDHGDVRHKWGIVYSARLHALIPLALRGAVWYQGEDDGRNRKYRDDLKAMIAAWRAGWGHRDMPFYMAQIAQTTYAGGMLRVWEAQSWIANNVPNTALAPSNDLSDRVRIDTGNRRRGGTGWPIVGGGNPHPPNRHIMGRRLARIALAKTYGRKDIVALGPMYASHQIGNVKVLVKFKHVGRGLKTDDGKEPNWFELSDGTKAGRGLKYVKARAKIVSKDSITLWSPEVGNPKHVRFAWHALARHNLYNKEGLPAITFRTDDGRMGSERH